MRTTCLAVDEAEEDVVFHRRVSPGATAASELNLLHGVIGETDDARGESGAFPDLEEVLRRTDILDARE